MLVDASRWEEAMQEPMSVVSSCSAWRVSESNCPRWRFLGKSAASCYLATLLLKTAGSSQIRFWQDSYQNKNFVSPANTNSVMSRTSEKDSHGSFSLSHMELLFLNSDRGQIHNFISHLITGWWEDGHPLDLDLTIFLLLQLELAWNRVECWEIFCV